jgi:hypothetical protein
MRLRGSGMNTKIKEITDLSDRTSQVSSYGAGDGSVIWVRPWHVGGWATCLLAFTFILAGNHSTCLLSVVNFAAGKGEWVSRCTNNAKKESAPGGTPVTMVASSICPAPVVPS